MRPPSFVAPLVDAVVRVCDPWEVLLFGSYAKGLADVHSDVDLLALCPAGPTWAQRQEITGLMSQWPVHVDVLLLTPADVRAAHADPNGFHGSALRSGMVVYQRSDLVKGARRC